VGIVEYKKQTMNRKKIIQKLQQLLDKLPKGKERKAIREILLNLKLNKNKV
jgi:hypothetical protein